MNEIELVQPKLKGTKIIVIIRKVAGAKLARRRKQMSAKLAVIKLEQDEEQRW